MDWRVSMSEFLFTDEGRWTPAAVRKRRSLIAAATWLNMPGRSWTLHNGNTILATMRRRPAGGHPVWMVRVEGHEYLVKPDMPAAKNGWPVGTYITVKAFPTAATAKREILRVLRTMPELQLTVTSAPTGRP